MFHQPEEICLLLATQGGNLLLQFIDLMFLLCIVTLKSFYLSFFATLLSWEHGNRAGEAGGERVRPVVQRR